MTTPRSRRRDRAPGLIDATQTRHHIERLTARGWTQDQIAAAAGLSQQAISLISTGSSSVRTSTARAVLGISLTQAPPPRAHTDVTGSRRRLQALAVLGYSVGEIALALGVARGVLDMALQPGSRQITTHTAEQLAVLYRRLAVLPAPRTSAARRTRERARARGWHGPMAWEDIDDPRCLPETDEVGRHRVDPQDVAELATLGLSDEEIARRLEVSPRTVLRIRRQQRIPSGVAA